MIAPRVFGIFAEIIIFADIAIIIKLSGEFVVLLSTHTIVIWIDERIRSRIIRRIDIDHLDLVVVRLLQDLEDIQIISFDEEILSTIPVYRLILFWMKRLRSTIFDHFEYSRLSSPSESISFFFVMIISEEVFECLWIKLPFLEKFWHQLLYLS